MAEDKLNIYNSVGTYIQTAGEPYTVERMKNWLIENGYKVKGYKTTRRNPSEKTDGIAFKNVKRVVVELEIGFLITAEGFVLAQTGRDKENRKEWLKQNYVKKTVTIEKNLYVEFEKYLNMPYSTWLKQKMQEEIDKHKE